VKKFLTADAEAREEALVSFKVGGQDVSAALTGLLRRFAEAVAEEKTFEIQDFPEVEVRPEVRPMSVQLYPMILCRRPNPLYLPAITSHPLRLKNQNPQTQRPESTDLEPTHCFPSPHQASHLQHPCPFLPKLAHPPHP
jgi:hypothetical protein